MGNVMAYSGITTKVRAMSAKLLKEKDYDTKQQPFYHINGGEEHERTNHHSGRWHMDFKPFAGTWLCRVCRRRMCAGCTAALNTA